MRPDLTTAGLDDNKLTYFHGDRFKQLSQGGGSVIRNLLLVAQEAMHNAIKHAQASHLQVNVSALDGGKRVGLVVRDDGAGFDPSGQPGPGVGHFGLQGMRERVERLGGTLRIESAPDRGTSVHVDVPLRAFDEEIA